MSNYTLESFINFCDDMMIAEEKLDLRILDGNFNKNITLFHGSERKLTVIRPTSVNVGNRLSQPRTSSFWTNNFKYAVLWALDWVAINCHDMPYYHDIDENLFVIPDVDLVEKDKDGNEIMCRNILQVIEDYLTKTPVFVYQASVPTKYVGRGQCAINEYTVDIPIKPNKTYEINFDTAKSYIKVISQQDFEYNVSKIDSFSKSRLSLRERLVFRNSAKIKQQRSEIYRSYQ